MADPVIGAILDFHDEYLLFGTFVWDNGELESTDGRLSGHIHSEVASLIGKFFRL